MFHINDVDFFHPALIITQGLPASGKSTWALDLIAWREKDKRSKMRRIVRVNRDALRIVTGAKYNPANESLVRQTRDAMIEMSLASGYIVISDDTNLVPSTVERLSQIAARAGAPVWINDSFMDVTVEECIERDAARTVSVGKDVIERMYYDFWKRQAPVANYGPKKAIIVDLDGTLALFPGRNPFNRDFSKDEVNVPVRTIMNSVLSHEGIHAIITSGRDEQHRKATQEWLAQWGITYHMLLMRPSNTNDIKDYMIKRKMFEEEIQGKFEIQFVIDDRPSVVRRWRAELGLTVFQGAPNLEF